MPDTSYHNWTMPTVDGSTDTWGQILNDMFDDEIDADVERRGTLADRPSAVDVPSGAKYLVTSGSEVGRVFIESGDSWTTLGAADLESAALDAIPEIDAALRSGLDTTLITGTAGTDGNVPEFNADGDIVDSGQAASDIGSGGGSDSTVVSGTPTLVEAADSPQALTAGNWYEVNTVNGAVELDLPTSPSQGDQVGIRVVNASNNVTTDPATNSVETEYATLDRLGSVVLQFGNNSFWRAAAEKYPDFSDQIVTGPDGTNYDSTDTWATLDDTGSASGDTSDIEKASQGFVAYQIPGNAVQTKNPNNFADLGAAVRSAITDAEAATSDVIRICIPHHAPDGTGVSVDAECTFSSTYPYFVGGRGDGGDFIDININDGSPAFHVGDMTLTSVVIRGAWAEAGGNDAEFIRFSDTSRPIYSGGNLRAFNTTTGSGAIVVNNRAFNGLIKDVSFNGLTSSSGTLDVSDMVCIGADNDTGNADDVGEWGVTGITSYADPSFPMHSVVSDNGTNWRNVRIVDNRLEGAGGDGSVDFSSGYPIVSHNQMGRTENTADRIHCTGNYAWIGPNVHSSSCGGVPVYIRIDQGTVINSVRYSVGASVAIDADYNPGGDNKVQVPDPSTFAAGATANYLSGASNVHVVQTASPS